jgi:hypothetical protein
VLKSGLKLSVLSMGGIAGGAAMVGTVVVVAVVIFALVSGGGALEPLGCSFRLRLQG